MIPLIDAAAPVLRAQHSLITRHQAIRLVNSEACVRHLLRRGIWETVDRGLYGPCGVPMSWHRLLMAAVLLAPDGSLISHRAGAALQRVGGLVEPRPEISIPRGGFFRRGWCITHESGDLHLAGGGALRDWLDRYFSIDGVSESGAEFVVLDAILHSGLPAPVRQHEVIVDGQRYRLDLAYPNGLICIEVDGRQHRDTDICEDDEARTARLKAAGWHIIRGPGRPPGHRPTRRAPRAPSATGSCVICRPGVARTHARFS